MDQNDIGTRLKLVRSMAGISGRRLGELAGLSSHYVVGLEASRWRDPRTEPLRKLAGVLGVTLDWLSAGDGAAPTADHVKEAVRAAEREAVEAGRVRPLRPRATRAPVCPKCGYQGAA